MAARERDNSLQMTALLAQYQSLRDESLNTSNNRITLFIAGIAAVITSGTAAVSLQESVGKLTVKLAFSGAIPVFSSIVLLVWLGEAVRSHRVGYYLAAEIEPKINALAGQRTMSWEMDLWSGRLSRDEAFGPSNIILLIFGLISATSPFVGLAITGEGSWGWIALPYLFLSLVASYVAGFLPRLRNDRDVRDVQAGGYSQARYSFRLFRWTLFGLLAATAIITASFVAFAPAISAATS